jgi:hypothetical protein
MVDGVDLVRELVIDDDLDHSRLSLPRWKVS